MPGRSFSDEKLAGMTSPMTVKMRDIVRMLQ
jgi:hypothetical protein